MGLNISRNSKGLYQIKSTVSDEIVHREKWITEDVAKAVLIERAADDFMRQVISIDLNFPDGYRVNGEVKDVKDKGLRFVIDLPDNGYWKAISNKFKEIKERLKIDFEL